MQNDIKERIKNVLNYYGSNVNCISSTPTEQKRLNNQINGTTQLSSDTISLIIDAFDEVSPEWLMTGRGNMIKTSITRQSNIPIYRDLIVVKEPDKNDKVAMQEYISNTRPHIPIDIAAGSLSATNITLTEANCPRKQYNPDFGNYDYTTNVRGDSMLERYRNGDLIACRIIDENRFIQWGEVHALDTTQGFVMKRIFDEGDCVKCISDNPNYPPFLIPKEDIFRMAKVVGFAGY